MLAMFPELKMGKLDRTTGRAGRVFVFNIHEMYSVDCCIWEKQAFHFFGYAVFLKLNRMHMGQTMFFIV